MAKRWTIRPEGSWGDWGPDDQLGRLNLIGPQQILRPSPKWEGVPSVSACPLPRRSVLNAVRHPPVLRPSSQQRLLQLCMEEL